MQNLNLSLDPIWLLANESNDTIWLALPDILLSDTPPLSCPKLRFSSQHSARVSDHLLCRWSLTVQTNGATSI